MRALSIVLLVTTILLAAATTTAFDQTNAANVISAGPRIVYSHATVRYDNSQRSLSSAVTAEASTDSEERGISSGIAKLKEKLKAKLKKMGITPQLLTKIKRRIRYYFWNQAWNIRYTIWLKRKVTPEEMYEKLSVRYTSGPWDKNYRVYNNYFRLYEHHYGPAYDPRTVYGPKVNW